MHMFIFAIGYEFVTHELDHRKKISGSSLAQ
jgi:hypothetical protein